MNISLDLMKRQINELGAKLVDEIEKLQSENRSLRESLKAQQAKDNDHHQQKSSRAFQNENYCSLNELIKTNITSCENELLNTKKNCNRVLRLDQRKMDNIKSRFNEIKINIEESNEARCNNGPSCEATANDIIESREHFEVLRKIYQETTHKLMIFRNALKERNLTERPPVISRPDRSRLVVDQRRRPRGMYENRLTSTSLSNDQVSVENGCERDGRRVAYANDNLNLEYSSEEEECESGSEEFENRCVLNYEYEEGKEEADEGSEFTDDGQEKELFVNEQWYELFIQA